MECRDAFEARRAWRCAARWCTKRVEIRKRRWREYRTSAGGRPVHNFLSDLSNAEVADIWHAMEVVAEDGLALSRHLRGDIYEVRADSEARSFRVLFALEGRVGQILLSLSVFEKRTQKTPPRELALAEFRLRDWRARGRKASH